MYLDATVFTTPRHTLSVSERHKDSKISLVQGMQRLIKWNRRIYLTPQSRTPLEHLNAKTNPSLGQVAFSLPRLVFLPYELIYFRYREARHHSCPGSALTLKFSTWPLTQTTFGEQRKPLGDCFCEGKDFFGILCSFLKHYWCHEQCSWNNAFHEYFAFVVGNA